MSRRANISPGTATAFMAGAVDQRLQDDTLSHIKRVGI